MDKLCKKNLKAYKSSGFSLSTNQPIYNFYFNVNSELEINAFSLNTLTI